MKYNPRLRSPRELAGEIWDDYVDLNYWYLDKLLFSGPLVSGATITLTYAAIGALSGQYLGAAFGMPAAGRRWGAMKGIHTLRYLQLSSMYHLYDHRWSYVPLAASIVGGQELQTTLHSNVGMQRGPVEGTYINPMGGSSDEAYYPFKGLVDRIFG